MSYVKITRNPCNGHTSLTVPRYAADHLIKGDTFECIVESGIITYIPVKKQQTAGV
jgi:hypothetical protein